LKLPLPRSPLSTLVLWARVIDGVGGGVGHLVEPDEAVAAHRLRVGGVDQRERRRHAVERGQAVAEGVVARVELLTRGPAVDRRLRGGLRDLGPGEEAAGGDAGLDEVAVVRAAVEGRRRRRQALK
jgi:hypothetical protein